MVYRLTGIQPAGPEMIYGEGLPLAYSMFLTDARWTSSRRLSKKSQTPTMKQ